MPPTGLRMSTLHDAGGICGSDAPDGSPDNTDDVRKRGLWLSNMQSTQSFRVRSHDEGGRVTPWHSHPEYEIHLMIGAVGRVYIGDRIGKFGPRHLTMTGPDVPHNWISTNRPVTRRGSQCVVIQFKSAFIENCIDQFPEMRSIRTLMLDAGRGIEFLEETITLVKPTIVALQYSRGVERIELFLKLLNDLTDCRRRCLLSGPAIEAPLADGADRSFRHVMTFIRTNYTGRLRQAELSALCGCSRTTFSRRFHRRTGMAFAAYVRHLRVLHSCDLLRLGVARIVDVGSASGFGSSASFEKQFQEHMKMSPAAFRERQVL